MRHGETEWSRDRKHTSRTDVPLTAEGRRQAEALRDALRGRLFAAVWTSPRVRATETCRLVGFGEVAVGRDELRELDGDAVVFSHGHFLRVLTARWLGLDLREGRLFALDTGTIGVLGYERETAVVRLWNETPR